MVLQPVQHRRVRRADFDSVRALLAESGLPSPTAERSDRHRFRRLMSDLGADLYLAERGLSALGIVHITYVRRLAAPAAARIELLLVSPPARLQGIGRGLVAFAVERARRRGCAVLRCRVGPGAEAARLFFGRTGWRGGVEEFEFDLARSAQ
jgi:GNAT superfamily N-acetyltransferase